MVKHLPTMRETRVQSLGREDLLEKEMETHSSILAWKTPRIEEPGRLQPMGSQRVRTRLSDFTSFTFTHPMLLADKVRDILLLPSYTLKEILSLHQRQSPRELQHSRGQFPEGNHMSIHHEAGPRIRNLHLDHSPPDSLSD